MGRNYHTKISVDKWYRNLLARAKKINIKNFTKLKSHQIKDFIIVKQSPYKIKIINDCFNSLIQSFGSPIMRQDVNQYNMNKHMFTKGIIRALHIEHNPVNNEFSMLCLIELCNEKLDYNYVLYDFETNELVDILNIDTSIEYSVDFDPEMLVNKMVDVDLYRNIRFN